MKILVMKFRNIGDVLLTTPLLANLKMHYPEARIDFALNKGCEAMILGNPNVSKVHIYDRNLAKGGVLNKIRTEFAFANQIRREKYDLAIQTTSGDRGILIAKYAKIPKIASFFGKNQLINKLITHKIESINTHTVLLNLQALKALNLDILTKEVKIYFDEFCLENFEIPDDFIHFHLTSRWMFKCANDEIMANLIDFCERELNFKVIITADNNQNEIQKVNQVLNFCKSSPVNLSGKLSLKQTASLSAKSRLFVGVDTAIMHIAAANNIPVVAFFGPSGAMHWGPWDNDNLGNPYQNRNGWQDMGKHSVIQSNLDCVPCGKDGCNGSKISDCLMKFTKNEIELIKEKIKSKLN